METGTVTTGFMQVVDDNKESNTTTTTTTETVDWRAYQKWADAWNRAQNDQCPSCGYCKHCGRGGHQTLPYYPYQPYFPPYNPYPYWYGNTIITKSAASDWELNNASQANT